MAKSLQEQLMQAGLVDKKKAKSLDKAKKHAKRIKAPGLNEAAKLAQQTQQEKLDRDKALNQKRNEKIAQKEVLTQINQLIQSNKIEAKGDISYQFSDGKTVKKIYVNTELQAQLINGIVAIVRQNEDYALIPKKVAEKLAQRDAELLVVLNSGDKVQLDSDDPYADYQIPDDLMW